jgi:hypothetical protein
MATCPAATGCTDAADPDLLLETHGRTAPALP